MSVNDTNKNGKITINNTEFIVYDDSVIKSEVEQLQTEINELDQEKHTHANKTTLDKLEQSGSESTIDISKLTVHETAIDNLSSISHSHSNKSSLDRLGISSSNKLTIDNEEEVSNEYTHPESHPASMITEDSMHRFVSDAEKETWNGKANGTHNHSLSNLIDVEINPIQLKDRDVLVFSDGKWQAETLNIEGNSLKLEDYSINESIEYLIPLDVIELQTIKVTKNSITLSWKSNPRNLYPLEYLVFAGDTLAGTTSENSFEITQLMSSTQYTFKVITKSGISRSIGRSIIAVTQGDFVLSLRGGSDYVETPPITFDAMEIICSLTPKVNSWSNYLIEGLASGIQIYTQHNGASYRRSWCDLYVNGKYEPSTSYGIIPSGEIVNVRIEGLEEKRITDQFNIFASKNNTTTMQGLLFRVRLYTRNGRGDLILKSDYDFTNKPAANYVTDLLNNSPALVIHGSIFVGN
ncbi:fibronectin type III domain-containing protein [Fictibacillus barbaricus]|uniref:Fibronectin type-III domain-containing protein n=1 Tax=Fictibacillus barbaricus TaxID=182136 RepID=A0ABU1U1N3_9BACL|nr:fibronectin type III domain-containing protein [Fictibacillus barbaricus]MDR7073311.1 hypothetical protein [Fictibacillus barbaricus]